MNYLKGYFTQVIIPFYSHFVPHALLTELSHSSATVYKPALNLH